jgi:hypothetical protein
MGLFDWLRGDAGAPREMPAHWGITCDEGWRSTDGWREWEPPLNLIVGESYRQEALQVLAGGPPRKRGYLVPVEVTLVREPKNENDANALLAFADGLEVGYLRREAALRYAPELDAAGVDAFRCAGVLRGGSTKRPHLGVHVWLGRLLDPGPPFYMEGGRQYEVGWPPYDDEGT